ncbi:hypothetical protein [Salibacterium aidingense]|uniref:hypothetical protein n=1 Tax=Salibacterium aidingense TaxID=384933 RepID=UPI0004181681|nr:hypothetical protein [Salibacterium aidingense]
MGHTQKYFFKVFFICLCLTGAAACEDKEEAGPAQVSYKGTNQAEQLLEDMEEVTSAVSVKEGKQIFAAVTVHQFDRLQLENIRKKGHSLLKEQWPEETVHFSTDYKSWLELNKYKEDRRNKSMSEKERKKRLTQIEEFMKG